MKWTKIDKNNKPEFNKQYLFGKPKDGFFSSKNVAYGTLFKIVKTDEQTETYYYDVSTVSWKNENYITSKFTHFIEVSSIPELPKKNQTK